MLRRASRFGEVLGLRVALSGVLQNRFHQFELRNTRNGTYDKPTPRDKKQLFPGRWGEAFKRWPIR